MAEGAVAPARSADARAWYGIWLIALVTLLANIDRHVITLLVEPMKADLHLSDTQLSLVIGTVFSLSYMVAGLPISRLSDIYSRKWVLAGGLVAWSVATASCGLARNFTQLCTSRGVVGAAEAVPGPASMSLIADFVPPEKLPRAFAVYQLGVGLGQQVALMIGGVLLGYFTSQGVVAGLSGLAPWQLVFFACGLPGLLVALLWMSTIREPARTNRTHPGTLPVREVAAFLRANGVLYLPLFGAIAIASIELFGLSAWRVSLFVRTFGWAPSQAGRLLGAAGLIVIPLALVAGTWFAETLLKRGDPRAMLRVSVITYSVTLPLNVLAPLMPWPWLCFALLSLGTLVHAMAGPAINSAIQYATPGEMRAQVSAIYLFMISVVGTLIGPLSVALVSDYVFRDEGMLRYAMSSFALVLGPCSILLMTRAMRAYGQVMQAGAVAVTS